MSLRRVSTISPSVRARFIAGWRLEGNGDVEIGLVFGGDVLAPEGDRCGARAIFVEDVDDAFDDLEGTGGLLGDGREHILVLGARGDRRRHVGDRLVARETHRFFSRPDRAIDARWRRAYHVAAGDRATRLRAPSGARRCSVAAACSPSARASSSSSSAEDASPLGLTDLEDADGAAVVDRRDGEERLELPGVEVLRHRLGDVDRRSGAG